MASQVSHIVYAKKLFESLESGGLSSEYLDHATIREILKHKDEFMLGCIFPDVRMVSKEISRKDTHMYFPVVNMDLRGLNPFQAGWKYHVYCDMKREEILNKYGFYKITEEVEKSWQANKMLEDKLIYSKYNNWEKMMYCLNNPIRMILMEKLTQEELDHWYAILAKYFEQEPNYRSMHIFLAKTKHPDVKKADVIVERLKKIEKLPGVEEILKNVVEEII